MTVTQWQQNVGYLEDSIFQRFGALGYAQLANGDSSVLGWNESYILDSYIQRYKNTDSISYLKQFVDHFDYSLSYLNDYNNDSYPSWDTVSTESKIVNPAFDELLVDPDKPYAEIPITTNKWVLGTGGNSQMVSYNTANADIEITSTNVNTPKLYYYITTYQPNADYTLSFDVKTANIGTGLGTRLFLTDYTPNTGIMSDINGNRIDIRSTNSDWSTVTVNFKTPSYVYKIGLVIQQTRLTDNAGTYYYKNFKLEQKSNFQIEDTSWVMLPDADAQHIYLDATESVSGNGLTVMTDVYGNTQGVKAAIKNYAPDLQYVLKFDAKTDSTGAGFRVYIKDDTTSQFMTLVNGSNSDISVTSQNEWTNYMYRFSVPNVSGHKISVYLTNANTQIQNGKSYFDNVTVNQVEEYLVHEAGMYTPAAKFIKEVYNNSVLSNTYYNGTSTYKDKADNYLMYVNKFINKWNRSWIDISSTEGVYRWTLDPNYTYYLNALPHNQYIKMVNVLLPMYDVTGNTEYLRKASAMLTFFKNKLQLLDGNMYYWHYYDPAFDTEVSQVIKAEDSSHGNLDIEAALEGYKHNLVFTNEDMLRFANTFVNIVWNGDVTNPVFYRFIETDEDSNYYYLNWPYDPDGFKDWVNLSPWKPEVFEAFKSFLTTTPSTGSSASKILTYTYMYPHVQDEQSVDATITAIHAQSYSNLGVTDINDQALKTAAISAVFSSIEAQYNVSSSVSWDGNKYIAEISKGIINKTVEITTATFVQLP